MEIIESGRKSDIKEIFLVRKPLRLRDSRSVFCDCLQIDLILIKCVVFVVLKKQNNLQSISKLTENMLF